MESHQHTDLSHVSEGDCFGPRCRKEQEETGRGEEGKEGRTYRIKLPRTNRRIYFVLESSAPLILSLPPSHRENRAFGLLQELMIKMILACPQGAYSLREEI